MYIKQVVCDTQSYIYIFLHIYICIYLYIQKHIYTYTHKYSYKQIYTYIYTHIHFYLHIHIIYIYYICIHIYIYIHRYIIIKLLLPLIFQNHFRVYLSQDNLGPTGMQLAGGLFLGVGVLSWGTKQDQPLFLRNSWPNTYFLNRIFFSEYHKRHRNPPWEHHDHYPYMVLTPSSMELSKQSHAVIHARPSEGEGAKVEVPYPVPCAHGAQVSGDRLTC